MILQLIQCLGHDRLPNEMKDEDARGFRRVLEGTNALL